MGAGSSQQESEKRIDILRQKGDNDIEIWESTNVPNQLFLKANMSEITKDFTYDELAHLIHFEKRLPKSVLPILNLADLQRSLSESNFEGGRRNKIRVEYKAEYVRQKLEDDQRKLKAEGAVMNELDIIGIIGILLITSTNLEIGLNHHPRIELNQLLLFDRSLLLSNPFFSAVHLRDVVEVACATNRKEHHSTDHKDRQSMERGVLH